MSQTYKTGQLFTVAGASGGQGLTLGATPNHKAVLFIAGSGAALAVTGKLFLGGTYGDSGNTLEGATFTINSVAATSILHPIRFSSISAMSGAGGSIQLLN